jgi:hypothetical protein
MPSYDPSFFNVDPYYNDFNEQKKYLKLLFRPGFALQARELSQIQSILQNQIERFGNFVFNDGSMVYGGQITEIPTFVSSLSGFSGIPIDLINDTIVEFTSEDEDDSSYAKILFANQIEGTNYIYYQFVSGQSLTASGTSLSGSSQGVQFSGNLEEFHDNAMVVFVDEGIRYTNGYFVYHEAQKIGLFTKDDSNLDISFSNLDKSVGFKVEKDIITSEKDSTLLDPASGSFNFNAPGADRFKIDLVIDQRNLDSEDIKSIAINPFSRTDYIEFLRVIDGNVVKKEKYAELGALEETFARRTYDESGHYIVNPFELTMKRSSDESKLISKLDSGKAYIFGYEFETQGSASLEHKKARTTNTVAEIPFGNRIGSYAIAEFSGFSSGLSSFGFTGTNNGINYPKILFDSFAGTVVEPEFGLRFEIEGTLDLERFTPGITIYFSSSSDFSELQQSDPPSAELKTIQIFSGYSLFEVGPISQEELDEISNYGESVFINTYSDDWEGSLSAGNISQFNIVLPSSITGGPLTTSIGSARVFNFQRQSGNRYKLFLSEIDINSPFRFSDARRAYIEGATGNPLFFFPESSPRIYNAGSDSKVFNTKFEEIVEEFTQTDFILDIFYNNLSFSGGVITINKETFAEQIGPNVSCNDSEISLKNCSFITLYDDLGELDGTYALTECGEDTAADPAKAIITPSREPVGNIRGIVSQRVRLSSSKRIKNLQSNVVVSLTGSSPTERYFLKNGNLLTDVFEVNSVSGLSPSSYILDTGQKNTHYDFSKLIFSGTLNSGATASISYYEHSNQGPFVGGLTGSSYPDIESPAEFTNNQGEKINLRSSLDFRPVRIGSLESFSLSGPYSKPASIFDGYDHASDYSYYLPRIDKVILSRNKRFRVLEGIPSDFPVPPNDDPDSMTLYTIVFNPYTFNENDVTISQEDNRRFTMKDIGTLEKRIESVEKYTSLNLLEQEAKNTVILDEMGIEVPKKAIITDQFQSSGNGDVLHPNFFCSVERETNELRPPFTVQTSSFFDTELSIPAGLTVSDNIIHLSFNSQSPSSPFIENELGNNYRQVNSSTMIDFLGSVKLTPFADKWFDDTKQPLVKSNSNGDNNSWLFGSKSFSMNSNYWDHNWFGKEINIVEKEFRKVLPKRSEIVNKELYLGGKVGSFTNPLSSVESINEKIIDRSIVPYCREKTIQLNAKFLKPNTTHYVFVDGEPLGDGLTAVTNEDGEINNLNITIPMSKFPTGKKVVRVADVENIEDIVKSSSSGDAIYYASGIVKDSESQNFIRPLIHRREASNTENITNDVLVREAQRAGRKSKNLRDPLSQMFTVDSERYRSGLFISSVNLYFDSYPTPQSGIDFNLPLRVQLRPSVNGYPSPSRIIAESIVKNSVINDINSSPEFPFPNSGIQAREVEFKFDYPVYLVPGEYALTVESNSDLHSIVTYVLPSTSNNTLDEDRTNFVDPMLGSIFLPKNTGKFEEITNEFLSIKINKANFSPPQSPIFFDLSLNSLEDANQLRSSVEGVFPSRTRGFLSIGNSQIPVNKTLDVTNNSQNTIIKMELSAEDSDVSPCVDIESSLLLSSKYEMVQSTSFEIDDELKPVILDPTSIGSRYMTKNLSLLSPAKNLRVIFDSNKPPDTRIEVFAKCLESGSGQSIDEIPYRRLSPIVNQGSSIGLDSFGRSEYTLRGFVPEFSAFSVKIIFVQSDGSKNYPRLKNLRIIAL